MEPRPTAGYPHVSSCPTNTVVARHVVGKVRDAFMIKRTLAGNIELYQ